MLYLGIIIGYFIGIVIPLLSEIRWKNPQQDNREVTLLRIRDAQYQELLAQLSSELEQRSLELQHLKSQMH